MCGSCTHCNHNIKHICLRTLLKELAKPKKSSRSSRLGVYVMAASASLDVLSNLTCPVCFDRFEDPALLDCGHTVCRECLRGVDDAHGYHDHLICPECRERTRLGQHRVDGLPRNIAVVRLMNDAKPHDRKCSLHEEEDKSIYCEDCHTFICPLCMFELHRDHEMKARRTFQDDINQRAESLFERCQSRKSVLAAKTQILANQEEQHALDGLRAQIKSAYTANLDVLKSEERTLMLEVEKIEHNFDEAKEGVIGLYIETIDRIDQLESVIKHEIDGGQESNVVAFAAACDELEKVLEIKTDGEELMAEVNYAVQNVRFFPENESNLAVCKIGVIKHQLPRSPDTSKNSPDTHGSRATSRSLETQGFWKLVIFLCVFFVCFFSLTVVIQLITIIFPFYCIMKLLKDR